MDLLGPSGVFLSSGPERFAKGIVMVRAFAICAIAAFVAAALTVLPGFAPDVKANSPRAAAKGDRLPIQTARVPCTQQSWPNVDASCLRRDNSEAMVRPVRIIAARRG